MTHKKYKEMLVLQIYNELSTNEQKILEEHLKECEECKNEKGNLKKFRSSIPGTVPFSENEDLIAESRKNLRYAVRANRRKKSVFKSLSEFWRYYPVKYKLAFGSLATIALGFFIGYLVFFNRININNADTGFIKISQNLEYGKPQMSGLKFIANEENTGEVEFTFDQTFPMHIKGNINEPQIQKFLANALVNEQNPGIRLKTVSMMAEKQQGKPDDEMKKSLINALKFDNNQGVRKEVIRVLRKLPFDNDIKDVFMYVLEHDKSSGMRIAAINSLGEAKDFEKISDVKMRTILKERELNDENGYIRVRAKSLLQEVRQ